MEKINQQSDVNKLHPYQYLTQLNTMYNCCNKTHMKSLAESKFKLAWKPFSIMKIPSCFQLTFNQSHKNDRHNKCEVKLSMEQSEKKIWKQHEEILKRYSKNNFSAKKFVRPQTCTNRNKNNKMQQLPRQNNLLLRKLVEKGVNLNYNKQDVEKQVLQKLKKSQAQTMKKQASRAQSALGCNKKQNDNRVIQQNKMNKGEYYFNDKPYPFKQRKNVEQKEYLTFTKNSQIVSNYKQKIKQVDCAISQLNIKKTANLLKNMENIVQRLQ